MSRSGKHICGIVASQEISSLVRVQAKVSPGKSEDCNMDLENEIDTVEGCFVRCLLP